MPKELTTTDRERIWDTALECIRNHGGTLSAWVIDARRARLALYEIDEPGEGKTLTEAGNRERLFPSTPVNGRLAYQAYAEAVAWQSEDGHVLLPWEQLRPGVRYAWDTAAEALLQAFFKRLAQWQLSELIGPDWEAHP